VTQVPAPSLSKCRRRRACPVRRQEFWSG